MSQPSRRPDSTARLRQSVSFFLSSRAVKIILSL